MFYQATLIVWSDLGNTPLTNRGGAFCDELINTEIQVRDDRDALEIARQVLANTRHAVRAHIAIPHYPNQNYRSLWV